MVFDNSQDLLEAGPPDGEARRARLAPVGFADWQAASRLFARLAADARLQAPLPALLPYLLSALSAAASPDRALVNFERFVQSAAEPAGLLHYLAGNPRSCEVLVTLFAGSQFLTEILLRNPNYFELLKDLRHLAQPQDAAQFQQAALQAASGLAYGEQLDALRRYQRRELLRAGACDLLDFFDLPAVTRQLSDLASGLLGACLQLVSARLELPSTEGFAVIGMGKLGGRELNYSSDIDLLFLGRRGTASYRRLGEKLIEALVKVTPEGFLYRVDMRLRPWGQVGALVPSLEGYLAYLREHARGWEKQSLLKARLVAGDSRLGAEFLDRIQPLLLEAEPAAVRSNVHAMKQRTEEYLRQQGRQWGEVKLGEGSIRDIEFITQYYQLAYGSRFPDILGPNTLQALARLFAHQLLSVNETRVLIDGYIFLRTVENHLQMMHYQQTNRLPGDPEALAQLARRLGFLGATAGDHFVLRYNQHCAAIRAVYVQHVGDGADSSATPGQSAGPAQHPDESGSHHHLLRMDPSYATVFSPQDIRLHAALAGQLDEENLVAVRASALPGDLWQITVVAYDYPGELSLICGLLFVYNLDILDGHVFTYAPQADSAAATAAASAREAPPADTRPKIVDVFTVRCLAGEPPADLAARYRADLAALLRLMHRGQRRQARTELAKRVALSLPEIAEPGRAPDPDLAPVAPPISPRLYPIQVEIDNAASRRYTVLKIDALDTPGFLYELTNSLAFQRVYIAQMTVDSIGSRVNDTLYVTNARGLKITSQEKQRELRAAIVLIKHFTHLLPQSPNPESALLHFGEFIEQLFTHPGWPDELASLERPEVLSALARLLGVSDFLWDDFLRMQHASLFPLVRDVGGLSSARTRQELQSGLEEAIASQDLPWRQALNAFKDRELFRSDMRNILGYTREFDQFSQELTELAEVVVAAACEHCFADLVAAFGGPTLEDGSFCPLSVCALGKCGGRELGFASDIELIFIYAGNGATTGATSITTAEFYEKLVENFLGAVQARREGIFQIDLQLRPYGKSASMAVPLELFRRYYAPEGPAWAYERQALIKLRPIAGDPGLGEQIVADRDAFVYNGEPFDVTTMRAMRERQIRHLVSAGTFNAKYSPGGLLDMEYLVQGLQITYGPGDASLRATNTRQALAALAARGLISPEAHTRLRKALTFLRWLIDSLRVVRGNAKDLTLPPADSEEFAFLARRLRYGKDLARLHAELNRYTTDVQQLNHQLLG